MYNDRDIKFDIVDSDRSPLEEQFCVFKISRCLPFSKWLPKYGIKYGRSDRKVFANSA